MQTKRAHDREAGSGQRVVPIRWTPQDPQDALNTRDICHLPIEGHKYLGTVAFERLCMSQGAVSGLPRHSDKGNGDSVTTVRKPLLQTIRI